MCTQRCNHFLQTAPALLWNVWIADSENDSSSGEKNVPHNQITVAFFNETPAEREHCLFVTEREVTAQGATVREPFLNNMWGLAQLCTRTEKMTLLITVKQSLEAFYTWANKTGCEWDTWLQQPCRHWDCGRGDKQGLCISWTPVSARLRQRLSVWRLTKTLGPREFIVTKRGAAPPFKH